MAKLAPQFARAGTASPLVRRPIIDFCIWVLNVRRVEVFFVFHPHANRLFHGPSFMNSLALPPSHPKFPCTPVLHAICAIGSLYTAAVTSPPLPNFSEVAPGMYHIIRR